LVAVAFLYLCFTGIMFLGSLILTTNHYPLFVAGVRFLVSGLILLTFYLSQHKNFQYAQLTQLITPLFFKYSLCLYTLSTIGFSWGLQYVDPVKACFVFVLAPFVTAIFLYFLKGEQLSTQKIIGLIIGFISVIPIILESSHGEFSHVPWHLSMIGYLVFASAVIFFAYGWTLSTELYQSIHNIPSLLITAIAFMLGGSISLIILLIIHPQEAFNIELTSEFGWLLLLYSILSAISYNLYTVLLRQYSPTFISFASFLEPAFGLLYAFLFLGQSLSIIAFCSLIGLGLGLYIFYQEELRSQ